MKAFQLRVLHFELETAVGHGTHVAGLIGSNHSYFTAGTDPKGACVHCGLQIWKTTFTECDDQSVPAIVSPNYSNAYFDRAAASVYAIDSGAQILNMSYNTYPQTIGVTPFTLTCRTRYLQNGQLAPTQNTNDPDCLAFAYGEQRLVAMVGSAGNRNFGDSGVAEWIPITAQDDRVISVGGTKFDGTLSNYSRYYTAQWTAPADQWIGVHERKQDGVAPADIVLSAIYRKSRYIVLDPNSPSVYDCVDTNLATLGGGPLDQVDDGAGYCTGTSMSAPIIAGILGMMRSANPNLPVGSSATLTPNSTLRGLLAAASTLPTNLPPLVRDPQLGYGSPNAARAIKRILGCVNDTQVKNRLTPLYTLQRNTVSDIAQVADPHRHGALYGLYRNFGGSTPAVAPKLSLGGWSASASGTAAVYVFTAPNYPLLGSKRSDLLTPIFQVRKILPNVANGIDHTIAFGTSDLARLDEQGYEYLGRMGYVLPQCTKEPFLLPSSPVSLVRRCTPPAGPSGHRDCAVFQPLDSNYSAFTEPAYFNAPVDVGCAYANVDADADALIDGTEALLGMDANSSDTDGDGQVDGAEYPLMGVSFSDPRNNGAGNCPI